MRVGRKENVGKLQFNEYPSPLEKAKHPDKSKFEKEDKNGYTSKKRPSNADSVCYSTEL